MDYKIILGVIATAIALAGYVPYFINIFAGKTKPHAFSWLVWATLMGIGFAAQVAGHGGPGAWATGSGALMCFIIFILALVKGSREFTPFDWICLALALCAMIAWGITGRALSAAILITLADAIGFLPTFKKGFYKPYEETVSMYALSAIKFIPALFALESRTLTTVLYPASLIAMNGIFSTYIIIRRRQCALKS